MKKRLLSILMAACLLVGLLPTAALAVSDVTINGGIVEAAGSGGDVTINGGIVEAAGSGGAGIGGGGCNLVGGGGGNAARGLLLLAVFCEKTECVLENVICGSQLGILSLKLPDADGLLLLTHHFRRWRVSAYAAPIRQCVVRDAQLLRGFLHADLV